jgi:uncharacterized membrane protein SirB2
MTLIDLFPHIKNLHIATVIFTGLFFLVRFIWMINGTLQQRGEWVRRLPAINDTILLVCGLTMTTVIQQYPFINGWLTAKVLALFAYIIFGLIALRLGKSRQIRINAGIFALLCYGYIVAAALIHHPFPLILIFS